MVAEEGDTAGGIAPEEDSQVPVDADGAVVRRRIDDGEPKSDAVLETVCALCDEADRLPSPLELEPLYETLDVDALDGLYRGDDDGAVAVAFTYAGFRITVVDDSVTVTAAGDGEP